MAERAPRRLIIPEYARLWFYNQTEKMAFRYIRSLYPISPQQTAEDITCSRLPKSGVSVNNLIVDATDCAYRYGVEDRYLNNIPIPWTSSVPRMLAMARTLGQVLSPEQQLTVDDMLYILAVGEFVESHKITKAFAKKPIRSGCMEKPTSCRTYFPLEIKSAKEAGNHAKRAYKLLRLRKALVSQKEKLNLPTKGRLEELVIFQE